MSRTRKAVSTLPKRLLSGTPADLKSLTPNAQPSFAIAASATRRASSGECCPSPSTNTTAPAEGRFASTHSIAVFIALPLPRLTSCASSTTEGGRRPKRSRSSTLPSSTTTTPANSPSSPSQSATRPGSGLNTGTMAIASVMDWRRMS